MEISNLSEILNPEAKRMIIERTGSPKPNSQGLCCPSCGAREVYANPADPENTDQWAFIIRAFRVDDASECRNCSKWFVC
jgi:hypothetical protein